jgi:2-methylisocitrate lyase-like PEP mutase family enzyme
MAGGDIVVAPGVYDGLSARLAARAGFAAAYATGGGIARSMGYPDLGLVSMTEMVCASPASSSTPASPSSRMPTRATAMR